MHDITASYDRPPHWKKCLNLWPKTTCFRAKLAVFREILFPATDLLDEYTARLYMNPLCIDRILNTEHYIFCNQIEINKYSRV
jgi:hypothetical protein